MGEAAVGVHAGADPVEDPVVAEPVHGGDHAGHVGGDGPLAVAADDRALLGDEAAPGLVLEAGDGEDERAEDGAEHLLLLFGLAALRTGGLALPTGLHLGANWINASVFGLGFATLLTLFVTPAALITANGLAAPYGLQVGERVAIPVPQQQQQMQQARREVLETHFEQSRLAATLRRISESQLEIHDVSRPTPFGFPLLIERINARLSNESLRDRIERMKETWTTA